MPQASAMSSAYLYPLLTALRTEDCTPVFLDTIGSPKVVAPFCQQRHPCDAPTATEVSDSSMQGMSHHCPCVLCGRSLTRREGCRPCELAPCVFFPAAHAGSLLTRGVRRGKRKTLTAGFRVAVMMGASRRRVAHQDRNPCVRVHRLLDAPPQSDLSFSQASES